MADKPNCENETVVRKEKIPVGLIILSVLSFIPFIGVFFGIISILISLFNFKRFKLILILGSSGIIFTAIIYSGLYYYGSKVSGGDVDELRVSMDKYLLSQIDDKVIIFKVHHGQYPNNLEDLLKEGYPLHIKDPIITVVKNYEGDSLFYYRSTFDSYELFSVGFDGKPHTKDDIYPNGNNPTEMSKLKQNKKAAP